MMEWLKRKLGIYDVLDGNLAIRGDIKELRDRVDIAIGKLGTIELELSMIRFDVSKHGMENVNSIREGLEGIKKTLDLNASWVEYDAVRFAIEKQDRDSHYDKSNPSMEKRIAEASQWAIHYLSHHGRPTLDPVRITNMVRARVNGYAETL